MRQLQPDVNWILVGSTRPDLDCMVAMSLFIILGCIPWHRMKFRFISDNEMVPTPKDENTRIAYFDIGKIGDIEAMRFDHHFKDTPWRSATEMVFIYFHGQHLADFRKARLEYKELVTYVNDVDDPERRERISDHAEYKYKALRHEIERHGLGDVLKVSVRRQGLEWLLDLVRGLDEDLSDSERVRWMWITLKTHLMKGVRHREIAQLIREEGKFSEANGLAILVVPPCAHYQKDIRATVGRNWKKKVDVLISQGSFTSMRSDPPIWVSVQRGMIDCVYGMNRLDDALIEEFPQLREKKLFFHHGGFTLRIPVAAGITVDTVLPVVMRTLRRQQPPKIGSVVREPPPPEPTIKVHWAK